MGSSFHCVVSYFVSERFENKFKSCKVVVNYILNVCEIPENQRNNSH